MPIVHANLLAGRSQEQKTAFARAVTQAAVDHLGVAPAAVRVLIQEIPPNDWFVAGEAKAPPGPAP